MKSPKAFLLGMLAGLIACYLTMSWRIGAADAHAKLYAVGAMTAYEQLQQCQGRSSPWPRKRGLAP